MKGLLMCFLFFSAGCSTFEKHQLQHGYCAWSCMLCMHTVGVCGKQGLTEGDVDVIEAVTQ